MFCPSFSLSRATSITLSRHFFAALRQRIPSICSGFHHGRTTVESSTETAELLASICQRRESLKNFCRLERLGEKTVAGKIESWRNGLWA
jgi:hypothetical protein